MGFLLLAAVIAPRSLPAQQDELPPNVRNKLNSMINKVSQAEAELELRQGSSKLIRMKSDIIRAAVADPQIIDFVAFGTREIELIGKSTGATTVSLWVGEKENPQVLTLLVNVIYDPYVDKRRKNEYQKLEDAVNELFPDSEIRLIPIADKLIVKGQASDEEAATRIMSIIRGREGTNVAADATGTGTGGGSVTAQGQAAVPFPDASDLPDSSVISMLEVPGAKQVMLKVRIAELKRSAIRQLGVNWDLDLQSMDLDDNFFIEAMSTSGDVIFNGTFNEEILNLMIDALAQNNMAKVLAEPNLVTISGQPATFLAGGQFAVPTTVGVQGVGAATTRFQGFGTRLIFTPTIIDKDRIRLSVSPSFSEVNQALSVNGIPGLNTRAASTTVDLREGQVLAIAGLIEQQKTGQRAQIPGLGSIPGAGIFFNDKSFRSDETELVIIVTPEIVHPLEPGEAPPLLPGMEVTEPTDYDLYLRNRIEGRPGLHHRSTVWPNYRDKLTNPKLYLSNHRKSEDYYMQGAHGLSH